MTGTGHTTYDVVESGDARIDGLLQTRAWDDAVVRFSFPVSDDEYGNYAYDEDDGLIGATAAMQNAARFALDLNFGPAANNGFAVEGFTNLRVSETANTGAHLRYAQTEDDPFGNGTAWAYYPSTSAAGGDIWFHTLNYDYTAPQAGNYAHLTLLHETGHALGLDHAHSGGPFGTVPASYDAMEYTVMTYRSFLGGGTTGYTNETWGYAQSFMMLDIAALQHMYGADFTTNSDDTTYRWTPGSGVTSVNGRAAIDPGDNRIFATIWDGGGTDTYDLSAYASSLWIDLTPGATSRFDDAQLARLGAGAYASGNIYNALLYQGDTRSLIENALGGSADDRIGGNLADNGLTGGAGNDRLMGRQGHDTLTGDSGDDTLIGGSGNDTLRGGTGSDQLHGQAGSDRLHGHAGSDVLFGDRGEDRMLGGSGSDIIWGGDHDDRLIGQGGDDALFGDAGDDVLIGGSGSDNLTGGSGADIFQFRAITDSALTNSDQITDFSSGTDLIDLSALSPTQFTFAIGGAFPATGPHVSVRSDGGNLQVLADVDGDGTADLRITLTGITTIEETDFLL